jgi:proline iminopeptidase
MIKLGRYLVALAVTVTALGQGSKTTEQPPSRQILTSDGVNLYVTVRGQGTSCLYIHGGQGSGSYWMEKFSGAMLERHFQMIYLDQRGSCRSSSPRNKDYSMDRIVRDFEEVRAALGITHWITLGHSFAGLLQMGYAQRYPEIIKGMIMLNCTLDLRGNSQESIPKACELLGIAERAAFLDESTPLPERISKLYGELRKKNLWWKMGYASFENFQLMNETFKEIPTFNHEFERIRLPEEYLTNFKPATDGLRMPVLYYYGKTDWMVGPNCAKGVNFPNMLLWASDVGHVPSLENPADLEKAIAQYQRNYGF